MQNRPGDDYPYYGHRVLLERLTNPDFDLALRKDFPSIDHRLSQGNDGVFVEDFESYADSFAFRTHPRWGFDHITQGYMEYRMDVVPGAGKNGSQALCVNHLFYADCLVARKKGPGPKHVLDKTLENGYVRFSIRQGPYSWYGKWTNEAHSLCLLLEDQEGNMNEIHASGIRGEEYLKLAEQKPDIRPLSNKKWTTVEIRFKDSAPARVLVDGKEIGDLSIRNLKALEWTVPLNTGSVFIDDLEVNYR